MCEPESSGGGGMPALIGAIAVFFGVAAAYEILGKAASYAASHEAEIIAFSAGGSLIFIGTMAAIIRGLHRHTVRITRPASQPARPELPTPLGAHEAIGPPERPFAMPHPEEASWVSGPAEQAEKCEGPECSRKLPESPWRAGTGIINTDHHGGDGEDGESTSSVLGDAHQFCSQFCMLQWMREDQAKQAVDAYHSRRR